MFINFLTIKHARVGYNINKYSTIQIEDNAIILDAAQENEELEFNSPSDAISGYEDIMDALHHKLLVVHIYYDKDYEGK